MEKTRVAGGGGEDHGSVPGKKSLHSVPLLLLLLFWQPFCVIILRLFGQKALFFWLRETVFFLKKIKK